MSTPSLDPPVTSPGHSRSWAPPHDPGALAPARHTLRRTLHRWGCADASVDEAELVLDELLTNAIEHARPPLRVRLHCPQAHRVVHIEVCDGGPARCEGPWTESCAPDEHGRGCLIVAALARSHGSGPYGDHGAVHWAQLSLGPAADPQPSR